VLSANVTTVMQYHTLKPPRLLARNYMPLSTLLIVFLHTNLWELNPHR